jgi:hypothetical protein
MTRIDGPIIEYACHEGNYQLPSIPEGRAAARGTRKVADGFSRPA